MSRGFAAVALILVAATGLRAEERPLALVGGTLIDGTGAPPRRGTLVVRGGRIAAILPEGAAPPPDARVVDVRGRTLIPGLIDVDFRAVGDASAPPAAAEPTLRALLSAGITTVRQLDGPETASLALRQAVASGALEGPRLLVAGPALDPTDGDDPAAIGREVRRRVDAGFDAIALGPHTPPGAVRAAVEVARPRGVTVVGRLRRTPWTAAARARIDGLIGPAPASIFYAQPRDRERLRMSLLRHGEAQAQVDWIECVDVDSEEMSRLRRWLKRREVVVTPQLERHQVELYDVAGERALRALWPRVVEHVRRLHAAGVPLAAGSGADASALRNGRDLRDEVELLATAGLTPLEAIRTATARAAEALGLEREVGTLREGRRADVVVLARSPLGDLKNLRRVEQVFLGGREWRAAAAPDDGAAHRSSGASSPKRSGLPISSSCFGRGRR